MKMRIILLCIVLVMLFVSCGEFGQPILYQVNKVDFDYARFKKQQSQ